MAVVKENVRKGDRVAAVGTIDTIGTTAARIIFPTGDPVSPSNSFEVTYDLLTFVNRPTPTEPPPGSIVEFRKTGTEARIVAIRSVDPPTKWWWGNDSYTWNQALTGIQSAFSTDNFEVNVVRSGP